MEEAAGDLCSFLGIYVYCKIYFFAGAIKRGSTWRRKLLEFSNPKSNTHCLMHVRDKVLICPSSQRVSRAREQRYYQLLWMILVTNKGLVYSASWHTQSTEILNSRCASHEPLLQKLKISHCQPPSWLLPRCVFYNWNYDYWCMNQAASALQNYQVGRGLWFKITTMKNPCRVC